MNDEKLIWDMLMEAIGNPYGVAGLMGNLFAESRLDSLCKTGGKNMDIISLTPEEYASFVMDGKITPYDFAHDECAFGLAQWRYWSRKEALYLFIRENKMDISDVSAQVKFLLKEIRTYKTVWNTLLNAKSLKEASDIVMERYERPANVSDKVKEKRAKFGQEYINKFAYAKTPDIPSSEPARIRTIMQNVNIRRGNGKKYGVISQIPNRGTTFPYVTKVGDWYAVEVVTGKQRQVGWISVDCSELI